MYWHIGDTTMRLGSLTPRKAKGLKRLQVIFLSDGIGKACDSIRISSPGHPGVVGERR
jgi:hypothetical protein